MIISTGLKVRVIIIAQDPAWSGFWTQFLLTLDLFYPATATLVPCTFQARSDFSFHMFPLSA